MAMPKFITHTTLNSPRSEHLRRTQVAAMLGLNGPGVDKLQAAGVLGRWPTRTEVDPLARRPRLQIASGELTVLRTNSVAPADPTVDPHDPRELIGFHVDHTDAELADSSLRWWRADAARITDNVLFAVTIATFPGALFLLDDEVRTHQRPGESFVRYAFNGKLIARLTPDLDVWIAPDIAPGLRDDAKQIMTSRITVASGGPIGYLEAGELLDNEG